MRKHIALILSLVCVLGFVGCNTEINSIDSPPAESSNDPVTPGEGPPSIQVNALHYVASPHLSVTNILPAGFAYAGETSIDGMDGYSYYTNTEIPEWVYVSQEVTTDGTVDESGTANRTEPHDAYVRYVDERLRGKDLVCYNGTYYISMWSASYWGNTPDVTQEYYNELKNTYGIRIEGDAPEGFVSIGVAKFSGHDTIPHGRLVSNEGACEIYANPGEPDVLLVSTQWYTAPIGKTGETSHSGFNIYIRYDCPLA